MLTYTTLKQSPSFLTEIYFLVASAYTHDVGMANLRELLEKTKLKSSEETTLN